MERTIWYYGLLYTRSELLEERERLLREADEAFDYLDAELLQESAEDFSRLIDELDSQED